MCFPKLGLTHTNTSKSIFMLLQCFASLDRALICLSYFRDYTLLILLNCHLINSSVLNGEIIREVNYSLHYHYSFFGWEKMKKQQEAQRQRLQLV